MSQRWLENIRKYVILFIDSRGKTLNALNNFFFFFKIMFQNGSKMEVMI